MTAVAFIEPHPLNDTPLLPPLAESRVLGEGARYVRVHRQGSSSDGLSGAVAP
jgi:hypothetical protein